MIRIAPGVLLFLRLMFAVAIIEGAALIYLHLPPRPFKAGDQLVFQPPVGEWSGWLQVNDVRNGVVYYDWKGGRFESVDCNFEVSEHELRKAGWRHKE